MIVAEASHSYYTECPQKKDEPIAPLFIGGF
jgi:hypothetical protein